MLLTLLVSLSTATASAGQTVAVNGQTPPNAVTVGAASSVTIAVSDGPGNTTDWIGLYPAGAADGGYLSWSYLNGTPTPPASGLTSATVAAYAPATPGEYEWRLFANNGFTRIATSSVVTVAASTAVLAVNGVTAPAHASVAAGTGMTVSITNGPGNATDWIALAPAGSPNSTSIDWRYLNGTTVPPASGSTSGTVQFLAPAVAGDYEVRLFAHNGLDLMTIATLSVSASAATLLVDDTAPPTPVPVVAGTYVTVDVGGGPAQPGDWVGLYASNGADAAYVSWKYLNGSTAIPPVGLTDATLTFAVPVHAGSYEFRFFNANTFTRLATSTSMVVSASSASLSVNGIAAPASTTAAAGSQAVVSISGGPANPGDWVGLYRAGESDAAVLDWRYLNDTAQLPATGLGTSTLHMGVPTAPGTYEFRFFTEAGERLTTSGPMVVPVTAAQILVNGMAPPATVTAPPGSTVSVAITGGPANPADWVALAVDGAPNNSYIAWQYLNGTHSAPVPGVSEATLSFDLPSTSGTYEVRLFANNTDQRITTSASINASEELPAVAVSVTSPFPGTTFNAPTSLLVSAAAWISGGSINRVDFYVDATLIGTIASEPFEVNWSNPAIGPHQLTAVVIDSSNATTTSPPVAVIIAPSGTDVGTLGAPIVDPPAGVYLDSVAVTLTAATGASVYYTTDGSDPTESSLLFEGSLWITSAATIRARAYQSGWTPSAITTAAYAIESSTPALMAFTPQTGAIGVRSTPITATFSSPMDETSFSDISVRLETLAGTRVSTTRSYDDLTRTLTLTPTTALVPLRGYRVIVVGGPSGVANTLGFPLAQTATWTFTSAAGNGVGAFWSFEEGYGDETGDSTGNGNTGSLLNGATWTDGKFGGGLSVDGVDDVARVPYCETLNFTTAMTMASWIKLTASPAGRVILSKEGTNAASYQLSFDNNDRLQGCLQLPAGVQCVSRSTPLALDQWTHVAVTYDGSFIKLFVDGVESDVEAASGSLVESNLPLWIGGDQDGDSLAGVIDEVRLYERALSVSQISALVTDRPGVSIDLTSPFTGTTFNAPAAIAVAATASVTGGAISRVDFYSGADLIGSAPATPYAITWVNPPQATHTLTAIAVDSIDGATTSSPVTITIGPAGEGAGTLGTPIASPPGREFAAAPEVTLVADPAATIRYTLDGAEPTELVTAYAAPIAVPSNGATLKARAFRTGWAPSAILSAVYEIDSTAPYLNITSPAPGLLVSPGPLTVEGTVLEQVSSATLTCNGTDATVADNTFSCEVTVPSGTSTVAIVATDATGNAREVELQLTTSDQIGVEPTSLRITPHTVTLLVGETRRFRALDNRGRVPADAVWTIDQEALATLSTTNSVKLTGVAAGDVTLTATWHGQSASATISIVTAVVAGTTLWSNPPVLSGGAVDDVVRGATAPDGTRLLYSVERHNEESVLRAFDPDGQEMWATNVAGRIDQLSGDPLGGAAVLMRTNWGEFPPARELHLFTPDGKIRTVPAVDSPGFAIHPDGPLYAVVGQQLKEIDIGMGGGHIIPLPAGTVRDTITGVPTVLADGSVTLPLSVFGGAHSAGESLDLLWRRPDGRVDVFPVERDPTHFFESFWVTPYKAIPNGQGSVLVAYDINYTHGFHYTEARLRQVNADGSFGGSSSWGGSTTIGSWLPDGHRAGTLVLGDDRVRATSYRFGSQGSYVRVSDVSFDGYPMTDFFVEGTSSPRFTALEGGEFFGSYADGYTDGPDPDHANVQLANAVYTGGGTYFGSAEGATSLKIGGITPVAASVWSGNQGGRQSANAPPTGRRFTTKDQAGIFAVRSYLHESLSLRQELGGRICATGPSRFFVTEPERLSNSISHVISTPCWPGIVQVGRYHTHVQEPVQDEPSGDDVRNVRADPQTNTPDGVTGYLGVRDADTRRESHVELVDCPGRGNIYKFEAVPYVAPPPGQPEPPVAYRLLQIIACASLTRGPQ